jgi:hypothetical protein
MDVMGKSDFYGKKCLKSLYRETFLIVYILTGAVQVNACVLLGLGFVVASQL